MFYSEFQLHSIKGCTALVCWLGQSLKEECIALTSELWSQGVAADLAYESLKLETLEDIQEFCKKQRIPYIVLITDRVLFYERKQVKVRTTESGKVTEKVIARKDLADFLQQKQTVDKTDAAEPVQFHAKSGVNTDSHIGAICPVNVTVIVQAGKLPGNINRKLHEQVKFDIHVEQHFA